MSDYNWWRWRKAAEEKPDALVKIIINNADGGTLGTYNAGHWYMIEDEIAHEVILVDEWKYLERPE